MILTVTLNAALDVTYDVPALTPHTSHRVSRVARRAGGKGLNVARVLRQLDHPVMVTGYAGGLTGQALVADLDAAGIDHRFVTLDGLVQTRETVTIVDRSSGDATVFLEPGPALGEPDWARFLDAYDTLAAAASCVVFSGSLPDGLPEDAYAQLCARSRARSLVDTGGPALVAAAHARADVLLPNLTELREATGRPEPVDGAADLIAAGARAVVVSLGPDGLLAVTPERTWRARAAERLRGNPTGAGDALTAAIAATLGRPWPERLREAVAWSAAAVPMPLAGEVDHGTLDRVRETALVDEMEGPDGPGANG